MGNDFSWHAVPATAGFVSLLRVIEHSYAATSDDDLEDEPGHQRITEGPSERSRVVYHDEYLVQSCQSHVCQRIQVAEQRPRDDHYAPADGTAHPEPFSYSSEC